MKPMSPDDLVAHPEGGRFQEVFRSTAQVMATGGRERSALTHIYFSLARGEVSRFHRVASDEVWNLYRGEGLRLHLWDGAGSAPVTVELSAARGVYCHVVPAGCWQAAEPLGNEVLVGCSVGPGFAFEDFELMNPEGAEAAAIRANWPEWMDFLGN